MQVLVGEHDVSRQDGELLVSPRSWTSHPLYHQPTTDYDFAIVKLLTHVRSAQYSQHIRTPWQVLPDGVPGVPALALRRLRLGHGHGVRLGHAEARGRHPQHPAEGAVLSSFR